MFVSELIITIIVIIFVSLIFYFLIKEYISLIKQGKLTFLGFIGILVFFFMFYCIQVCFVDLKNCLITSLGG